ncbi:hypothetical protein [Paracoccus sp. (in: a-proteobacteria)]|uniref:hypothetical protein n=1 Tax=Paracoccus sp. TaxID=267 RepID=UPI003A883958
MREAANICLSRGGRWPGDAMRPGSGRPIRTTDALSRFQWIKRLPGNALVDIDVLTGPFSAEALALAPADGARPVLIIDQSTITRPER